MLGAFQSRQKRMPPIFAIDMEVRIVTLLLDYKHSQYPRISDNIDLLFTE